jgi:hypothetical protein
MEKFGSGRSGERSLTAARIVALIGLLLGVGLGKLLADVALLYYGNLGENPLGLYRTTILATNLSFICAFGVSLAAIGSQVGPRLSKKEVSRFFVDRAPAWIGTSAGCMAGLLTALLSRGLVEVYLRWRIPVDEEGFAPIRGALPAFHLLFAAMLSALFAIEGRRFASRPFGTIKPRHMVGWAWLVRLMLSLAAAMIGVEFAFDLSTSMLRPLGEFLRPLAHPEDDLRWLLVLSWGILASILAIPLALGGQAVGRWLPLGFALIGLRAGIHAGELSALLVWDYYDERAQSFDDLSVVYMSARLAFGCLWATLLAATGFWVGSKVEPRLRAAGA